MNPPTKPGQRCKVIGSRMAFNGEGQGPNQGKTVITMWRHIDLAGMEREVVWHCRATNGQTLQTYYGAGPEADFLECWLEVQPDEPEAPKVDTTEKELEQ